MTETREIGGKTYKVENGKIICQDGTVISGYGIRPAPKAVLDAVRAKGADITGRVWYAGKYFVYRELAELAEAQQDQIRKDEEAALLAAVPGLRELEAAINEEIGYRRAFDRMMADEDNDGVRPPRKPTEDVEALRAQYPVAAAYLKAESWSCASHDVKASAGRRAMAAIRGGQDYNIVIDKMEQDWSAWCSEHVD